MTIAALLELGIVAGSLSTASGAAVVASRARAAARADRLALRLARAREAAFVDAARRLAGAARDSVDAVRDEIARAARVAAPAIDGVLMYEQHDAALRCIAAFGDRFAYFAGSPVALDDASALPARAIAAGHRVTLDDADVRPLHPSDVAALAVPLVIDAGRACVLVTAAQQPLDAGAIERLVALADQASPAYLIALDREHDRRSAEYDGLTGLLTPRAFRRRLNALVDRARFVPCARLALLFVDTDRFKHYNDRHGHGAGDTLLRELASVLRATATSEHDLVARNGGDEFCIVFTETDKATAIERADELRSRIATLDLTRLRTQPSPAEDDLRITASIGVAAFPSDAATANDLLERADAAMYHTKKTGRNGVSYADADRTLVRKEGPDAAPSIQSG
ncbi:MAG TPA: GGDEF domain-containing protein [Candidatus Elarobacter sp.]|nr:GGDEF domain-containing protein [Candidatus Elarobacter sp.]HEV2741246.1 GGDEF domain-containing protein [Candidatus Elarobacter sp.]